MKLALDYDGTYTLDPDFWLDVVDLARIYGHEVRIVTHRDERLDRTAPLAKAEQAVPVIYTRGISKRFFCEHFSDFVPDVWIDDKPESITHNSSISPEGLAEWRASREDGPHIGDIEC